MLVNPGSIFLTHRGQTNRLFSPRLWKEAKGQMLAPDGSLLGKLIVEDFNTFGGILDSDISATVGSYVGEAGHYYSYQDSSDTIAQIATDANGVVQLTTAATDNNECWLQPGSATSVSSVISDTSGSDKVVIFEARVKPSSVTNNQMAWFVGLTEEGCAVANTKSDNDGIFDSTGANVDKDVIGFDVVHADGDALNVIYGKSGAARTTAISGVQALTAATWYNIGLVYNPRATNDKKIKFFVNNVEQSTYVTAANIAASTFPDGEELQPLFGLKNGETTACNLQIDGWALYYGA